MAKELPFFKFEPAEYLTKDISFCSLSAQGLFINICSYYWQRGCQLTKDQLLRRLNYENELNELISEGVIDLVHEDIKIKFLDNQLLLATEFSKTQSEKGKKGGRHKKTEEKPEESQNKPGEKPGGSQNKPGEKPGGSHKIREDEIREDEINNSAFVFECLNSRQWIETVCMSKKITIEQCESKLKEFEAHLIITSEKKQNKKQFQDHFNNWLEKNKSIQQTQHPNGIGRTNQRLNTYDD